MGDYRKKYDEEFKTNAVKLSYASPKTVREIADDLGIHESLLYSWRGSIQRTVIKQRIHQWKKKTEICKGN